VLADTAVRRLSSDRVYRGQRCPFCLSGRCWCSTDAKSRPAVELIRAVRPTIGTRTRFSNLLLLLACPYGRRPSSSTPLRKERTSTVAASATMHTLTVSLSLSFYIYINTSLNACGRNATSVCL
jgi:hypothetical protein